MPRINKYIGLMGTDKRFSSMDASSGYWQNPEREEEQDNAAILRHAGVCY